MNYSKVINRRQSWTEKTYGIARKFGADAYPNQECRKTNKQKKNQ
jgi:hypothetical protein